MKKILCIVLSVLMLSGTAVFSSASVIKEGRCGEEVYYKLTSDGKLNIWGSGATYDYTDNLSLTDELSPFYENLSIKEVKIEKGVFTVGKNIFSSCKNLEAVVLPEGLREIKYCAFRYCENLRTINFPEGLETIEGWAFDSCMNLQSALLPSTVKNLEDSAFQHCTTLKKINIPAALTSIGKSVFVSCYELESIDADALNPSYTSVNGVLFNKEKTSLVCCPGGIKTDSYTVPASVTVLQDYCFSGCRQLKTVKLHENIKDIGAYAFSGCNSLTSVNIPGKITSVKEGTFSYCTALTSFCIPGNIRTIGSWAFNGCRQLTSVFVPLSVVFADLYSFDNCSLLKDVYYEGTKEQWKQIDMMNGRNEFEGMKIHCNCNAAAGDVDGSGNITASDARTALRASVSLDVFNAYEFRLADADSDGHITASDARIILRKSVGLTD